MTRELIYSTIKSYRKERTRGSIAEFNRDSYDETFLFTRIGKGSLGGKGRGLAFVAMEMKAAGIGKKYKDIYVSIPRTIVISTELFDSFLALNDFWPGDFADKNDREILSSFLAASLPKELEKDIEKIVSVITAPVTSIGNAIPSFVINGINTFLLTCLNRIPDFFAPNDCCTIT